MIRSILVGNSICSQSLKNGHAPIAPAKSPSPSARQTYTFQTGERYSTVAAKFNVDYAALLALNKVDQTALATPGTAVLIPSATPATAAQSPSGTVVECASRPHFVDAEDIGFLTQKPVFDDTHIKLNGYANGWVVDPAYVKAHYGPEYYKQNPDGSLDLNLVIYFQPQSYFYIGLAVSGATLLGCLGYLGYAFARGRRRRRRLLAGPVAAVASAPAALAKDLPVVTPKPRVVRPRRKKIDLS